MSIQKKSMVYVIILFSACLFAQEGESFDLEENENVSSAPTVKTFSDCFKSKELHLKKTSGSYMIQVPYEGKHTISITDSYGKVLSTLITTDKDEWYDIEKSLPAGTYVVKMKTPEMKLFKFVVVI